MRPYSGPHGCHRRTGRQANERCGLNTSTFLIVSTPPHHMTISSHTNATEHQLITSHASSSHSPVFITLSSAYATGLRIRVMLALVLVGYERNQDSSIAHARFAL